MRKGATLCSLAALAVAVAWLSAPGQALSAAMEPTDSGAPSAIVIFPVGEQPGPADSGMPPVAFNHVVHEKWMNRTKKDCMVCHHTGDAVACTTCHTVQGTPESKNVSLHTAMHAPTVKSRDEYPPSSCVSCHSKMEEMRNCSGCHEQFVRNARSSSQWCAVCHTISPSMTKEQYAKGASNSLPDVQNFRIAEDTALARKPVQYWSPMTAPYKVNINTLASTYQPCVFNHRHHVISMLDRIKDNPLAGAFHSNPGTICVACHHNSPATKTPPKCSNCHAKNINPSKPGMPSLQPAFHRLCMNCHTDMQVARPRNTDCETCHKPRPAMAAN